MYIDLAEVVRIAVTKALAEKNTEMSEEEYAQFYLKLQRSPEFLKAYKNSLKMED